MSHETFGLFERTRRGDMIEGHVRHGAGIAAATRRTGVWEAWATRRDGSGLIVIDAPLRLGSVTIRDPRAISHFAEPELRALCDRFNVHATRREDVLRALLGREIEVWREQFRNLVVNVGLDDSLDVHLSGGTQDTSWFVGLKDTGTPAAGDTLASHASWAEITPYAGNRLAWTDGGVSGQSVDNSGSPAAFAINATDTVFGAFLCGVNSGTAGILYAAGDFAASRDVVNGDTLNVTATFTAAAA